MTPETLKAATGCSNDAAYQWAAMIGLVLDEYAINTRNKVAMFLAQVGHESGSFRYVAEIWGPTEAQKRYEGRKDLGNTHPGDGFRFRGHGPIQITGRANHAEMRDRLRTRLGPSVPDFEETPEALMQPMWGAYAAGEYWSARNLNPLAEREDIEGVTRKINGGLNGLEDRTRRYHKAKEALWNYSTVSAQPSSPSSPPISGPSESVDQKPLQTSLGKTLSALWNQIAALLKRK